MVVLKSTLASVCLLSVLLAMALPPVATADPGACPLGGTSPCVNVTLVQHVADLFRITAGTGPTFATVQEQIGSLTVMVGGSQLFRGDMLVAQADGLPDPAVLNQDRGVVATHYEAASSSTLAVVPSLTESFGPVVAQVWLANLEVRLATGVHYVVLVAVVVPA